MKIVHNVITTLKDTQYGNIIVSMSKTGINFSCYYNGNKKLKLVCKIEYEEISKEFDEQLQERKIRKDIRKLKEIE